MNTTRRRPSLVPFGGAILILLLPPSIGSWPPTIAVLAADWPQLGGNPQRWNFSPETIEPPYREVWAVDVAASSNASHKICACVQPIIGGGLVYVGTKSGLLIAFDAKTGAVRWQFQAAGPILHTAGYADEKAFTASMDGCVYAVDAKTGAETWRFKSGRRFGFSTAILLADRSVFVLDRMGMLFALRQADGKELWRYDTQTLALQSPAYNNGMVFFGTEDMRVHAVDARTGVEKWRSEPLAGRGFIRHWPVVVKGQVIVRTANIRDRKLWEQGKPAHLQNLFCLDERTGKESAVLPHYGHGMHEPSPPPTVTRDGRLVVPWEHRPPGSTFDLYGWALVDLDTGTMIEKLANTDKNLMYGMGAPDEEMASSVIGDVVFAVHNNHGGNPPTQSGAFDLRTKRWYCERAFPGRSRLHYRCQHEVDESGGVHGMSAADGLLYHNILGIVECHAGRQTGPVSAAKKH